MGQVNAQTKNTSQKMTKENSGILDKYLDEHIDDPELAAETLAIDLMEEFSRIMEENDISRSELSDMMGVSRAYVTKLFKAPPNMTLLSIARLCKALKIKPSIGLRLNSTSCKG